METVLIYLAKSSAILGIFYIIYIAFLNKETFFQINRLYLISGIFMALVIPFISITKTVYIDPIPLTPAEYIYVPASLLEASLNETASEGTSALQINWLYVFAGLYAIGMLFMLTKLVIQLFSVFRIIRNNKRVIENGIHYVETNEEHPPFSFFKYVVYNPTLFSKEELDIILKHEKAHSKERHSIDILASKILVIYQWLNPFAWLYQKSVAQNLEYLADQKATQDMTCRKAYQLALLKATSANQLSITNNFFNSLIKKRIIMLQQQESKKRNMLKLALVIPAIIAFVVVFNTEVIAQERDDRHDVSELTPMETPEIAEIPEAEIVRVSAPAIPTAPVVAVGDITITIDKNTTKKDLERYKKKMKKEGVDFKYKKLKYNDNNELTSISITVKGKNGKSGSYSLSSDEGIEPFTVSSNDDGFSFNGGNDAHFGHGEYFVIRGDDDHDNMRKHKVKVKAHKMHGKNHDASTWISDDGKKIHIGKSKVMIIDEDGEHQTHDIEIDGDGEGTIIINGKKMDFSDMDIDLDMDELFDGNMFKIEMDVDGEDKKLFLNGKEMDIEEMREKAEKMSKEMKDRTRVMVLRSNEMKEKMKEHREEIIELKKKMKNEFIWEEKGEDGKVKIRKKVIEIDGDDDENVFFFRGGDEDGESIFEHKKKFSFVDDPNIEKLIIIDGKEATFAQLDKLAKEDKLDSVDFLKSKTAVSIYGDKAKDGAIIATSKK